MKFDRKKLAQDIQYMKRPALALGIYCIISEVLLHKTCIFRILFGIPCPGCGLTRAMLLAVRGHWKEAAEMHPFWIVFVVGVPVALMERYLIFPDRKKVVVQRIMQVILFFVMSSFIAFYVYRMIRYFPEQSPMKYEPDNLRKYL